MEVFNDSNSTRTNVYENDGHSMTDIVYDKCPKFKIKLEKQERVAKFSNKNAKYKTLKERVLSANLFLKSIRLESGWLPDICFVTCIFASSERTRYTIFRIY